MMVKVKGQRSKVRVSPQRLAHGLLKICRVQRYTKYIEKHQHLRIKTKKAVLYSPFIFINSLRVSAPLRFISDNSVSIFKRKDAEPQSIFHFSICIGCVSKKCLTI